MLIILAMCITILINVLITIVVLKINNDFMAKILSETENRFDKKINLKEVISNKRL